MDILVVELAEKVALGLAAGVIIGAVRRLFTRKAPARTELMHNSLQAESADLPVERRNPLDALAYLMVKVGIALLLAAFAVAMLTGWLQETGIDDLWVQRISLGTFVIVCIGMLWLFLVPRD